VTIAIIVGICILLAVLGLLLPRVSRTAQHGVDRSLDVGQRGAGKAPGAAGRWLQKPFSSSRRAADRSAAAGRRGHFKLRP
jgi:hypothetical protein